MNIQHASGSYEIQVCSLQDAVSKLPTESRIVTDRNVESLVSDLVEGHSRRAVAPGEQSKSLETYGSLLRWLAETRTSRGATVVALGGGVVGDLAGFVASSYMRGVAFIQIPTTLLSMVDSSVGGKVGIDLPEGKNLVGAFKAPNAVYLPIELLPRLPEAQFRNGMAEVLKYGFIMDAPLSDFLVKDRLGPSSEALSEVVLRCVELKAQVVEEDEFETTGRRAILNFGHTIGHAVEHALWKSGMLHGEAISIGMVAEAHLGEILGLTPAGLAQRVQSDLASYQLPTRLPKELSIDALIQTMARDKKAEPGNLAFSLLTDLGRCKLVRKVDADAVRQALRLS